MAWTSPPYYRADMTARERSETIVRFSEYSSIADHARPLIVCREGLTIFGAEHTRDPQDPQIALIEREWHRLRPTVALVEGRLGFLLPSVMDPVRKFGEGGKVKELADADDVPVFNWDLPKQTLAVRLMTFFEPDQIALAQILNPYFGNRRFGRPDSPGSFIEEYLDRAVYVGREQAFTSAADVDRIWKRYFPDGPDWRDVSDEYGLPGYLEDMSAASNDLRNQQLLAAVGELLDSGKKVFVVCGSSHAACLEPAL